MELDLRRLYLGEGCSSLFTYCMLVATLHPRPDVPSTVRKLPPPQMAAMVIAAPPVTATAELPPAPEALARIPPTPRAAEVKPIAPERYKVQFTVGREVYEKLRRVQDLLRHTVPSGDPVMIFERALGLLLDQLERARMAKTTRPRAAHAVQQGSRHVPASMRRTVWERDGGRCAFNGREGRCAETGFLEYHHLVPFASGGQATAGNLELRCRAHNQYESDVWFGVTQHRDVREERAVFGA